MALKDIEKLREKVEKDPNSKLFVPLAEEYRKEGLLDEAINVLLNGLERQPGYASARVSLGKIYVEKGMLNEAKTEFENVIKSIPDNLYAYKKLAEIYSVIGEKEQAIKAFKTVLRLNPMDEDSLTQLKAIETQDEPVTVPEKELPQDELPEFEDAIPSVEEPAEPVQPEDVVEEIFSDTKEEVKSVHSEEDLNSFRESIFAAKEETAVKPSVSEDETEIGEFEITEEEVNGLGNGVSFDHFDKAAEVFGGEEDSKADLTGTAELPEEMAFSIDEEIVQASAGLPVPDEQLFTQTARDEKVQAESADEISLIDEEIPVIEEPPVKEDISEEMSFGDLGDIREDEQTETGSLSGAPSEDIFSDARDKETVTTTGLSIGEADKYISEGNYLKAMNVYRCILSSNPEDKTVLQRVEELRTLLKLTGKDKDALIARLDAFLEGIRKRHNEFLGSS